MTIMNQGLSIAKIKQIITQLVASTIETIVINETKTRVACESMNQTKRQEDKMAENARNKRKWEGDHGRSSIQNKEYKVIRAHAIGQAIRRFMLKSYPIATSASCTTMDRALQSARIARRLVIWPGIVREPLLQLIKEPSWKIKEPLLALNVGNKGTIVVNAHS
nr:hypothetical protein [Tanacetum cinerariifolium]